VPTLYTAYSRAIQYLPQQHFTLSYLLVQPKSAAAVPGIKRKVAQLGYVDFTKDEFNSSIAAHYIYKTGVGTNILLMTFIIEDLDQFGALNAIGARGRKLIYMILSMAALTSLT
jgi:putative ABC transport system permease protein